MSRTFRLWKFQIVSDCLEILDIFEILEIIDRWPQATPGDHKNSQVNFLDDYL